jgi:hypothetical protein
MCFRETLRLEEFLLLVGEWVDDAATNSPILLNPSRSEEGAILLLESRVESALAILGDP